MLIFFWLMVRYLGVFEPEGFPNLAGEELDGLAGLAEVLVDAAGSSSALLIVALLFALLFIVNIVFVPLPVRHGLDI